MLLEDHDVESLEWTRLDGVSNDLDVDIAVSGGCRIERIERRGALDVVRIVTEGAGQIVLQTPLGNASGFWNPEFTLAPALPADWRGHESFSAVKSAPVGVLTDIDGTSSLAFGFDCVVDEGVLQFGASEESKSFVVRLGVSAELARRRGAIDLAVVTSRPPYEEAIRLLSDFLHGGAGHRPISRTATRPVYSTWYAYSQAVSARIVEDEARMARELGCRSVFIDDGWQAFGDGRWYAGCGDWIPDTAKFPDLRGTVDGLHALDMDVVLWIAPLLLGVQSAAYEDLRRFAPLHSPGLRADVLDPRRREVRAHVAATCARLVRDYDLDGLKIDFLNNAMVYAGTPSDGDIDDVGRAMVALLREVADEVDAVRPGTLIEFRQPYVSPAVAPFADVIRADDCPADADQNRRSIVDLRLFAERQIVHSDPLMWDPTAGPDAPARQVLNAFFGVPQLSMPLGSLPASHARVVAELIAEWEGLRDTLLGGELFAALPAEGYPIVGCRREDALVVAAYQPRVLELALDGVATLSIVNATASTSLPYALAGDPVRGILRAPGTEPTPVVLSGRGFLDVPAWGVVHLDLAG
ncbi:glycoside hydrolase family 36 protein [Microbacterium sp. ASV49]|uniref:Alpha-galactosidase n=1 Tax=Microbacterium candidum TaxID=3041922 RepID=A0ABT7N0I4_9MICO|nr:glycoside hydrolase family 36 protein [Microbacterium sp. ASV49]MDL9980215.1 alpha-galactosidase [Microbacterium sp. ASV49]